MEGAPTAPLDPLGLIPEAGEGWQVALLTPGLDPGYSGGPLVLSDSTAIAFHRPA